MAMDLFVPLPKMPPLHLLDFPCMPVIILSFSSNATPERHLRTILSYDALCCSYHITPFCIAYSTKIIQYSFMCWIPHLLFTCLSLISMMRIVNSMTEGALFIVSTMTPDATTVPGPQASVNIPW